MQNRTSNAQVIRHDGDQCSGFAQMLWNSPRAAALALLLIVLPACDSQEQAVSPGTGEVVEPAAETVSPEAVSPETASPETTTPVAGATTGAVAETPNANLIGESVTVSTKVIRIISPEAFVVQDKESLGGQEVLVVTNYNSPAVAVGKNIELTGIVRQLVVVDVEKEYGFDLEPGVEAEFKDKPIITAKAIEEVD
ncbi:hypothetical protein H6F98_08005 [Microcoleus sp. FACHB-SPT15]|uniref:hypothetical protein n=1 Tax=Microcoleus sp. FACHB-SPT15 TaxID=2692830 RepID=UPI0017849748|nr:hypothetical protein [Microcoleus sp. FACHB-SPT15]MBD1805391.1 hypothetical protein [Microcoleus sp. FACHB-SPT15]